jgi:hypothetical protein
MWTFMRDNYCSDAEVAVGFFERIGEKLIHISGDGILFCHPIQS